MIPKPITREDMYYSYLINGSGSLPKPITRKEMYLYYLCVNGHGSGGETGGSGGAQNYNSLTEKPQINNVTLQGSLTSQDLRIQEFSGNYQDLQNAPQSLPNPQPVTFGGMLSSVSYDGSQAVNITFPNVELTNQSAGTPVGEIISFMGTIAPANYLICDGTVYQIADYPYLAQHFVDNFGKANYFGGDGVDTFAVPDLRGEFLRGTGANAHYKQGAGSGVGGHQDATQIQNVFMEASNKRIYAFGASGYASGTVINQDSVIATRAGQGSYNADAQNGNTSAQISIYTPRPTNTSVLYLIKYQPTYWITPTNLSEDGTA